MAKNSKSKVDPLSEWAIQRRVIRITDTQTNASHLYIEERCPECSQCLHRSAAIHGPARDGAFVCPGKVFDARDQLMLAAVLEESYLPSRPNSRGWSNDDKLYSPALRNTGGTVSTPWNTHQRRAE